MRSASPPLAASVSTPAIGRSAGGGAARMAGFEGLRLAQASTAGVLGTMAARRVRLVATADAAAHARPCLDRADPRVEIARQLRIAAVAIGDKRAKRGRILPRLQHEDAVGVGRIE